MKLLDAKAILVAILLAAGALVLSGSAHARARVFIGPVWGPWYYPPPYYYYPPNYYYPPSVTAPSSPPVYIEQNSGGTPPAQQQQQPYYWYHCANPDGYYPYVKECPAGWQRVDPQPRPPS
jgi:hypothetical protein